jgi:hypothetical protein
MTEFLFGDNCTYCVSKFGSEHCLLPYQIVKNYVPPTEQVMRAIEISELHAHYGVDALATNLEAFKWIANRSGSRISASVSSVSATGSQAWSDQMSYSADAYPPVSVTDPGHGTQPTLSFSRPDWILNQSSSDSDTGVKITQPKQSEGSPVVKATLTSIPIENDDGLTSPKSEDRKSLTPRSEFKSLFNSGEVKVTSRDDRNHLITDLIVMAKTAYNLHRTRRDWIKVSQLKESLMYESNLVSTMGARYRASRDTSLDGNKVLAKEIVGCHTADEIHDWECTNMTDRKSFCLLNCRAFALPMKTENDLPLGESLIQTFFLILDTHDDGKDSESSISKAVEFELSKSEHKSTLEWMKNRDYFFRTRSLSGETSSYYGTIKGKVKEEDNPYPPIDDKLLEFINVRLQVTVNKEIEQAGKEIPTMPDKTTHQKFFYKLAVEFLRRNKGWHNENSFTKPAHLTKLEDSTKLRTQSSESLLTFMILKRIIDNFRIAYKQRYPKAVFQP